MLFLVNLWYLLIPVHGSIFPSFTNTGYLIVRIFSGGKRYYQCHIFTLTFLLPILFVCIHTSINKVPFLRLMFIFVSSCSKLSMQV